MIEIRKIMKQIEHKQNLDSNLSIYGNWIMSASNRYAYIRLALNYFTYYETIMFKNDISSDLNHVTATVNQVIAALTNGEINLEQLEEARNHVTASMEAITSYTDCLQIFEYVLNRLEGKFKDTDPVSYDYNTLRTDLMSYLMSADDNVIMNGRIQEVVGQLPIRMTKSKFFSLVKEALSIYTGSERNNVEDFFYLLRSSAMLSKPEKREEGFEYLYDAVQEFEQVDYKNLNTSSYKEKMDKLFSISERITDEASCYLMLQEVINDTYVILLSQNYAIVEAKEQDICKTIIKNVNERFALKQNISAEDPLMNLLTKLEGKQEGLYETYFANEYLISQIYLDQKSYLFNATNEELYQNLFYIEKLMSSSSFVSLHEKELDNQIADRAYMEYITDKLIDEFNEIFSRFPKEVNRAIMAKTLSSLPVFFHSADDINTYIKVCLESCKDQMELESCAELLIELMESENEMV